jgi:hypothetical protein
VTWCDRFNGDDEEPPDPAEDEEAAADWPGDQCCGGACVYPTLPSFYVVEDGRVRPFVRDEWD